MKPHPTLTLARALLAIGALAATPAMAGPPPPDASLIEVTEAAPHPQGDVLEVAAASGQFQTFLRAVQIAGYEDTLRGQGPFTVFAPTDTAFRAMGQQQVDRLLDPRHHEELLALLAYHVVPERITSESVHGQLVREETAGGYRVQVDGRDGLRVNDKLVAVPDLGASNGVIQGINSVLSPPVLVASR